MNVSAEHTLVRITIIYISIELWADLKFKDKLSNSIANKTVKNYYIERYNNRYISRTQTDGITLSIGKVIVKNIYDIRAPRTIES